MFWFCSHKGTNFRQKRYLWGMKPSCQLTDYIENCILPRYDAFDPAHGRDHARWVIDESLRLAAHYDVDHSMVLAAAAFHDTGLAFGRDEHHIHSARIIREDEFLRTLFTSEQIDIIADAAEDHRASSSHAPRTLYGRIVAEADRQIDPEVVMRRTVQFGLRHYPHLSREEHFERFCSNLHEKYGREGYLRLWIPFSDNATRLETLRTIIDSPALLRHHFDRLWE